MRSICLSAAFVIGAILVSSGIVAAPQGSKLASGVETDINRTWAENSKATQAEDLDAMMKTIHTKSPIYASTKQQLSQVFGKNLNANYKLLSFKYLATDGDYAMARIRQKTTAKVENFKANEIDMLVAFRKEGETWKIWTQAILEIEFLNE